MRGGRIARPDRVDAGPLSIKGPCQAAAVLSLPGSRRGGGIHFDIPPPQPPTRARPRPPPRGGEDPPPPGRYGCGLVAVSTASGPAWRGSTTSLACCCQAATPFPPQARRVGRRSPGGGGGGRPPTARPSSLPLSLPLPANDSDVLVFLQRPKTVLCCSVAARPTGARRCRVRHCGCRRGPRRERWQRNADRESGGRLVTPLAFWRPSPQPTPCAP